jgi:pimeloyl-ACP methyl ester carboxylesterase
MFNGGESSSGAIRAGSATRGRTISQLMPAALTGALIVASCAGDPDPTSSRSGDPGPTKETPTQVGAADQDFDGLVEIDDGRRLYLRCTGTGSPTVVLEGGDDDTSDSYGFAENALGEVTRTCVYDRANLGRSDPDRRYRGLTELVSDLEQVLASAKVPGPYVLVGTSGGGYITAGYAFDHPDQVAGMVFVEVPAPFRNPPAEIIEVTRWNAPENVESRDYLQVEKDAWAARQRVGDIPLIVISNEYDPDEIAASPFASERHAMRTNVDQQRGWLILSPQAQQVVVHTGHAVEEANPDLVTNHILAIIEDARRGG